MVEQPVGRAAKAALLQIHQQEGEIVEHVAAGDLVGEFDRVEQGRLAVDEDDVAQMQVAVTAAHEPGRPAGEQHGPRDREGEARSPG